MYSVTAVHLLNGSQERGTTLTTEKVSLVNKNYLFSIFLKYNMYDQSSFSTTNNSEK